MREVRDGEGKGAPCVTQADGLQLLLLTGFTHIGFVRGPETSVVRLVDETPPTWPSLPGHSLKEQSQFQTLLFHNPAIN